jgi:NADPH-dependent curcumin reductase CurA
MWRLLSIDRTVVIIKKGFTAYGSLIAIGEPKAGETIFISAAAGAIGQLVGQIAKLKGLRVIGSTSSDAKAEFLRQELKFDVAINYKKGSLVESLRAAAPEGIDIYYDNVGGDLLDAALEVIKPHGRILACGMVSGYNTKEGYAYKNLFRIVTKRLTIKGFLVQEFDPALQERFAKDVRTWLLNGDIRYKEDITEGLEAAPEAFVGIFEGKNVGKAVVKIADL